MPHILLYRVASDGTRTPALEVDTVISAGTSSEVQLTDNPVEDGADVTDHQVERNDAHEVEAVVTDHPMSGTPQPGRARAAWETLKEVKKSREVLVLVLPLVGDQLSVRLQSHRLTANVGTGADALRFTASFRQVRVVASQRVPALKRKETKLKPEVELGEQSTTLADDATAGRSRTLLKQLITSLRGD